MTTAAFITGDYALHVKKPEPNGCAHYRMVLPSRELQKSGWDTVMGLPREHPEGGIGVAYEDGALFGFDMSIYKLMMHETVPTHFKIMQDQGSKIIVDVDDFHFGIDPENIAATQSDPNKHPDNNRMFFEMGIRQADLVTTSTNFLANFYERRCRKVRLVRNALDVERYETNSQPDSAGALQISGGADPAKARANSEMPRVVRYVSRVMHGDASILHKTRHPLAQ